MMRTSTENVTSTMTEDYKVEMGRIKEIQEKINNVVSISQRPATNVRTASRIIKRTIGHSSKDNEREGKIQRSYILSRTVCLIL